MFIYRTYGTWYATVFWIDADVRRNTNIHISYVTLLRFWFFRKSSTVIFCVLLISELRDWKVTVGPNRKDCSYVSTSVDEFSCAIPLELKAALTIKRVKHRIQKNLRTIIISVLVFRLYFFWYRYFFDKNAFL